MAVQRLNVCFALLGLAQALSDNAAEPQPSCIDDSCAAAGVEAALQEDSSAPAVHLLQRAASSLAGKAAAKAAVLEPPKTMRGFMGVWNGSEILGSGSRSAVASHPHDGAGHTTMWTTTRYGMVGSACQYANAAQGGLNSPAATSPYIRRPRFCAVNEGMWDHGRICGECYHISYDGSPATDPGAPGDDFVQIVDSGSWQTFDCEIDSFHRITDARTGIFPVSFHSMPCDVSPGGAVATVVASSRYFIIVLFSNLASPVSYADMHAGSMGLGLLRQAAAWQASTAQVHGESLSFHIRLVNGADVNFPNCFPTWPMPPGSSCTSEGAHGHAPAPGPGPQPAPSPGPGGGDSEPPANCGARFSPCSADEPCCDRDARGELECATFDQYFSQCLPKGEASHWHATTRAPTPGSHVDAACSAHPACNGLRGDCCPSRSGVNLICCHR